MGEILSHRLSGPEREELKCGGMMSEHALLYIEELEDRCEQAERDRDKLAAVVKRWWHNGYEWKQSLRSRDGAIADFLIYSELSREDFDRLIAKGE